MTQSFCIFKNNKANNYGGALYLVGAASVTRNIFENNGTDSLREGGALYYYVSNRNNLFYGNIFSNNTALSGAAMNLYQGTDLSYSTSFVNNTVINNTSKAGKSGAFALSKGKIDLKNNII